MGRAYQEQLDLDDEFDSWVETGLARAEYDTESGRNTH